MEAETLESVLSKNHTHFLLVDDGMRDRHSLRSAAIFRRELERVISTSKEEGGCGVPVVRLVLGGGFDVLEDAVESIRSGIPIVICAGTGGAADILGEAVRCWGTEKR